MKLPRFFLGRSKMGFFALLLLGFQSAADLPKKLSELGLFTDLQNMAPAANVEPFDVNSPLWSDGAKKNRWIFLPEGTQIELDVNQKMKFPVGTMLIKQFEFERKVETRIEMLAPQGWRYGAYVWNDRQDDAFLTEEEIVMMVRTPASNQPVAWSVPGRQDCLLCHSQTFRTGSPVLGFSLEQMDHLQAQSWWQNKRFAGIIPDPAQFSPLINLKTELIPTDHDDPLYKLTIEKMARSYLAVNCASCHQPGGFVPTLLDFRWGTKSADLFAIGENPNFNPLGYWDAKIIDAGRKENSLVWLRMQATGNGHMPYLGSKVVDPKGLEIVGRWIDSLVQ